MEASAKLISKMRFKRAMQLSVDCYSPVQAMLGDVCGMSYSFEII